MTFSKTPIRVEADLIVDTRTMRRIAGVRTSGSRQRHLLYRAGHLYVDLQIRQLPGTRELQMIGQLVSDQGSQPHAAVPLALESPSGAVRRSQSDEIGEFLFSCPRSEATTLAIDCGDELTLEIPIPALEPVLAGRPS